MRLFTAALASLALLSASPAAAAPKAAKAAPAAKPAPAADPAPASSGGGFDLSKASVAAFIDGEFGDLDGFALRVDGIMPIQPLSSTIDLLGVVQLGFTHLGADIPYGDVAWNMVKVTAVGRGQMALTPEIDAYADLGLGFYFGGWKSEATIPFYGTVSGSDTTGGLQMRIAAGGTYRVNQQMGIGAELGFNPYFGDAETTNFFIGAGVTYKL